MQALAKQRRKIVIVGDGASGKTSLVNVYAQKAFPDNYMPTVFENTLVNTVVSIDAGRKRTQNQPCEVAIWDTAGQEDYDRLRPLSYPDTDVVLLCFCIDEPQSLDNVIQRWHPEIVHFLPNVPRMLVGLKSDLRGRSDVVSLSEAQAVANKIGAAGPYMECSALTHENIEDVFEAALRLSFATGISASATVRKLASFRGRLRRFLCLPQEQAASRV